MEEGLSDSVEVLYEGKKLTFWLTPNLTFQDLKNDVCNIFGLAPSRCLLCDPLGHYWPSSALVRDCAARLGQDFRISIVSKEHTLGHSSSTIDAAATVSTPPHSPHSSRKKAPVRLSYYADNREHSSQVLRDASIRQPRSLGLKSTKLSWERPPKRVLLILKPGVDVILGYAATVGKWLISKGLQVHVEDDILEQ